MNLLGNLKKRDDPEFRTTMQDRNEIQKLNQHILVNSGESKPVETMFELGDDEWLDSEMGDKDKEILSDDMLERFFLSDSDSDTHYLQQEIFDRKLMRRNEGKEVDGVPERSIKPRSPKPEPEKQVWCTEQEGVRAEDERKKRELERLRGLELKYWGMKVSEERRRREKDEEVRRLKEKMEEEKRLMEERSRTKLEEEKKIMEEKLRKEIKEEAKERERKKAEIKFSHIKKGKKIGEGGVGSVYNATWDKEGGEVEVAIKEVILTKELEEEDLDEFFAMYECHHPLILPVFGYCYSKKDSLLWIVMKRAHSSLFKYIHVLQKGKLSLSEKLQLMKKTTQCIQYLHMEKKMIHRDIKSPNFLVNKHGDEVLVCDFGLVKTRLNSSSSVKSISKGTLRWMGPELFGWPAKYSFSSDVYALAMVFYEILCESPPFVDEYKAGEMTDTNIGRAVESGYRPKFDKAVPKNFADLVKKCWCPEPKKRLSTSGILKEISKLEKSLLSQNAFKTNF